jgi:group I intron endonuclease
MPLLFKPGFIYLIRNRVNGKGYVGQTVKSVRKRFAEHLRSAENGSEYAIHCAIRKHGAHNFEVETVVACDSALLNALEEYCVVFYGTFAAIGHGYNMTNGGKATSGWSPSAATREKMSKTQKGRKQAPEHTAKIKAAKRPYEHSPEMRRKISEACKGKKKPRRAKG